MRIAVVQLGYDDDETFDARVDRVAALVAEQAGHDLVVLPELWGATGFGYTRWDAAAQPLDGPWAARHVGCRPRGIRGAARGVVRRAARARPAPTATTSPTPRCCSGPTGERLAVYRKIHRFGFGAGEPKLMEAGSDVVVTEIPSGTGGSVMVGLSTCYDLRFPELYRRQVEAGAELFVVPAAWPAARVGHWTLLGPRPRRREPVRRRAVQHRRHPRRLRDGRSQPGRHRERRGAGRGHGCGAAGAVGRGRPRPPRRRTARPSRCSPTAASDRAVRHTGRRRGEGCRGSGRPGDGGDLREWRCHSTAIPAGGPEPGRWTRAGRWTSGAGGPEPVRGAASGMVWA